MGTATNLGLGGEPAKFLGAYIINVNNSLGLSQSPSTASVTLVEDDCSVPAVLFEPPELGRYKELEVGENFKFCGVITKYEQDVRNISGRTITVDIADPREIMKSIPIILAPGFRGVVDGIENTECSVIDAYGAFDDFNQTGANLSGYNQTGMSFASVILALKGGTRVVNILNSDPIIFKVEAQVAKAFGERYLFDLSEVEPLINEEQRINTNLISMADFVQELANSNAFDWFTECSQREDGVIVVTIKPIDRRQDNTDIDLDNFLAINSGIVISAKKGFELRNDVACSVLLGAPVEFLQRVNINGLANNPVDLSDEGGNERYFMVEDEMRAVLANKISWESWVERNGGLARYDIADTDVIPVFSTVNTADKNQLGRNPDRLIGAQPNQENSRGKIFEKLKGAAEATYGKRFLFNKPAGLDIIDAAWTVDVVAGNSDTNEYFRNSEGKTRAYVEFVQTLGDVDITEQPPTILGDPIGNATKGPDAAVALNLSLANDFALDDVILELDKADYIIRDSSLFVAATIEEGGIVRIDAPAIIANADVREFQEQIEALRDQSTTTTADGTVTTKAKKDLRRNSAQHGGLNAVVEVHAKAYQPVNVYLPTRNKTLRYGPVFSSNVSATSQGKLEIIQDDGFAPWEFGSIQLMIDAMQFKVDNQSSNVKVVETADITVENFPRFSIGESLGLNSNINNITISFGGQVTTSYRLQSFQRKFGELSKEELAALSLFARRSGARTFPQDSLGFIERFRTRIQRQFSGRGAAFTSATTGGGSSFE